MQPTLSSFYGMMPHNHSDLRDYSQSGDESRALTPTLSLQKKSSSLERIKSIKNYALKLSTSPSKMRFSIVVNHLKESEKIMKENYMLSKQAIAKARPERNVLYKDTSSVFV